MKRKRGHKKGKAKGTTNHGSSSANANSKEEETSGLDDKDHSGMEVDTPSSTGTDQQHNYNVANINPDGSVDKAAIGRVKVKLKTPKLLDSQPTSSDAPTPTQSDTERMEDSANLLPDMKLSTLSKRAASIKIKSSSNHQTFSASTQHNNKQELDASLVVIRKVMKMDAAEPFNVPVNPEALGIPDLLFCMNNMGACFHYESHTERTSAEDIALSGDGKAGKGGQLKQKTKKRHGRHHKHDCLCAICVLKRRRKEREENARIARGNFGSSGDKHANEESIQVESPGGEDSSSNIDESIGTDGDVDEEKGEVAKMEISEKQCSPSERKHPSIDVDNDDDNDDHGLEEGEEEEEEGEEEEEEEENEEEEDEEEIEMNSQKREMNETLKHGGTLAEKSNVGDATALHDEYRTKQQEGQAAAVPQQKKPKGSQDKQQKGKLLESLYSENPKLSSLCGILFPQNSQSVWSGPHSLIRKTNSARTSSIHAAIRTFME
ncbi:hypothetical protein JHK85_044579 [Glycine max]|nr:hypothetical protein JHK85_044579 [Glycine max]